MGVCGMAHALPAGMYLASRPLRLSWLLGQSLAALLYLSLGRVSDVVVLLVPNLHDAPAPVPASPTPPRSPAPQSLGIFGVRPVEAASPACLSAGGAGGAGGESNDDVIVLGRGLRRSGVIGQRGDLPAATPAHEEVGEQSHQGQAKPEHIPHILHKP